MAETQTAYARSAISDISNVFNFVVLLFMLPEVRELIPPKYLPLAMALVAAGNLALRTIFVTHPVAMILPTQVKPVEVRKLEATKQGTEDAINLPTQLPSGEVPK